jgi:hypothetical protein
MIISVHVPKTAGNSFRECLADSFGDRLLSDYGDWAGCDLPAATARSAMRTAAMRNRAPELLTNYDVIHGHFAADKYLGLFPSAEYVAFFRHPYQQAIAHYYFLLRNPQREHPEERVLHDEQMTLLDYLEWDAFRNHQTKYLGSLSIDDFSMIGLSCEFRKSLWAFRKIFGVDLGDERFCNVNPGVAGPYVLTRDVKRAIDKHRAADIELYRRAIEIFQKQSAAVAA